MARNITQDTRDFRELCELTERICGYMPKSLPKMYGKHKWQTLLNLWHKHYSTDIFSDALRYSVNPDAFQKYTHEKKQLLKKIADLIYSDQQACQSWKESDKLNDLLVIPLENYPLSSREYNIFTNAYYKHLVERNLTQSNSPCSIKILENERNMLNSFTKIIQILIPSAESWTSSQWLDTNLLLSELKNQYGIDFLQEYDYDWIENDGIFQNMFRIFLDHLRNREPLPGVYLTASFNLPMARVLWGDKAETFLLDYYIKCIEIAKSDNANNHNEEAFLRYAKDIFMSSWLNAYVKEWYQDSDSPYHHAARRIIFEFKLCLPEYLPKEFDF